MLLSLIPVFNTMTFCEGPKFTIFSLFPKATFISKPMLINSLENSQSLELFLYLLITLRFHKCKTGYEEEIQSVEGIHGELKPLIPHMIVAQCPVIK